MSRDEHLEDPETTPKERAELFRRIRKIRFAMVTTRRHDGSLASRPMTLQDVDADGTMWFFASADTQLADDVSADATVNVAFADKDDDFYLAAAGEAHFIDDRQKVESLWGMMAAAWFDGPTDASLWLLRVCPERIDYWKAGAGKVLQLAAMAKAALTGTRPGDAVGEHGTFDPRVS
jgi:general stress protein 26